MKPTKQDEIDFGRAEKQVLKLLSDRRWHTTREVERAAGRCGQPASEGTRRLRTLRKRFRIDCVRAPGGKGRKFVYKLMGKKAA